MRERRRHQRRTGAERRSWERRAMVHRGRFLMGLGGADLSVERRQTLRRTEYRRSVNNRRLGSLNSLRESMRSLTPGTPVTLQIQREGRLMYVSFTFE